MAFTNEQEMLQAIVEMIEQSTGLVLDQEHVKELLIEVQREQLKGFVYRAFMALNQAQADAATPTEEPVNGSVESNA